MINTKNIFLTNAKVFFSIAKESFDSMEADEKRNKRPKPNGEPGHILTSDPNQRGFKNALICIVFCGTFLEALFHLLIVARFGESGYKKHDRDTYEKKLELLGCKDQVLMDACKHFRDCRKEIVHEKAHFIQNKFRIAQDEARTSMKLLESICQFFDAELEK